MDLKPFKLDIDVLIDEFSGRGSPSFAEFKAVWLSKKFSFIFEASPSTNHGFFMQSLYAHCIGNMVSAGSLANRLGGFYCLYCLYEIQPFKPPYKIYLSLGELRQIKILAIDARAADVNVVPVLLKKMLERNVFLFGFVGVDECSAADRVNELTDIQNARVQTAYKKLFADSQLEHFIHMDMGTELDVEVFKKNSYSYAFAKDLAIKEASQVVDVQNIKHIAEKEKIFIGDTLEKIAADWNSQKELLYEQNGLTRIPHQEDGGSHNEHQDNDNIEQDDDPDNFGKELEEALLFEPEECADEELDPTDYLEEDDEQC